MTIMVRWGRRLSDKIIDAFEMACDKDDDDAAEGLYHVLELVLTRQGGAGIHDQRQNMEFIAQTSDRLMALREKLKAA